MSPVVLYTRTGKRLRQYPLAPPSVGSSGLLTGPYRVTVPADPTIRPTGPGYVRYEDLYQSGDTVTAAMARLTTPEVITFPEGVFSCVDFATGYQAGITIPPMCQGVIGSGKGTLGGTSGTIFTMVPNSSTAVSRGWIPAQGIPTQVNIMKHYPNQSGVKTYKNFQVAGTDQGHVFHDMQIFGTPDAVLFEDVLLCGWDGDNGAPPGETFGLQVSGVGAHVFRRVEANGRRAPGGLEYGGAGMTFQKCVGATFDRCAISGCRAAPAVFYNSFDCVAIDCIFDSRVSAGRNAGPGSCINLEAFDGIQLIRPTLYGQQGKPHITASGDQGTLTRDGVTHSAASGTLEVVDPVNNDILGNPRLYIQTWDPYSRGSDTVGVSTYTYPADAPSVHTAAGAHIPYTWILAGVHRIIN